MEKICITFDKQEAEFLLSAVKSRYTPINDVMLNVLRKLQSIIKDED
jgi:hypothetical protein